MHAVESKAGPRFGGFCVTGSRVVFKICSALWVCLESQRVSSGAQGQKEQKKKHRNENCKKAETIVLFVLSSKKETFWKHA